MHMCRYLKRLAAPLLVLFLGGGLAACNAVAEPIQRRSTGDIVMTPRASERDSMARETASWHSTVRRSFVSLEPVPAGECGDGVCQYTGEITEF